jgi:hypothetical protein
VDQLHRATTAVLTELRGLEAVKYGPAELVRAAAGELAGALVHLESLGPAGGHPPLAAIEADHPELATQCAAIRADAKQIAIERDRLALELRRLLADMREVMSITTRSAGTYDAAGRTTSGSLRRTRAAL